MWKRMHVGFWIFFSILLIYIGISVYFMEHFFPGTEINNRKVDFLTTQEAMTQVLADAKGYTLTVKNRDGESQVFTTEDLGVSFCENDAVNVVKRLQNGFLWPRILWQKDSYLLVPGISLEEETFAKALEDFPWLEEGEEARNAWVELTGDGYRVHPEKNGTKLDTGQLAEVLKSALSNMLTEVDLEAFGCYQMPAVTTDSEEITELTKTLDQWLSACITYEFGPETEVVSREEIAGFLSLEENSPQLDTQAVKAWIETLAGERDTYRTERKFKSTKRGTISIKGGNTGWQIDQEKELGALLAHIEQGEQLTKEPAYLRTGKPWSDNYDIGDTYIEIDLSQQHMWVYKEKELLIETDVVTGNMRRGFDTPEMVAAVKYKARNAVLRGQGYASPVKYWMPFYGNYGIHDAGWRSNFGGDIYLTSGSHGCVNTPREAMKVIFENIEKGTPVVLYY